MNPGFSLDAFISGFDAAQLAAASDASAKQVNVFNLVARRVKDASVKRILQFILASDPGEIRADNALQTRIINDLNLKAADLRRWYEPGNPIIHLENTPVAQRMEGLLGKVALGNKGTAQVAKLDFDLTTYSLSAVVDVRHRHSWGSLRSILK